MKEVALQMHVGLRLQDTGMALVTQSSGDYYCQYGWWYSESTLSSVARNGGFEARRDPRGDLHAQVGRPASDCAETATIPTIKAERTNDFMFADLFCVAIRVALEVL
jgi:hypothetical protein